MKKLVEVSPDEELVEVSPDEELVEVSPDEELVEVSPKNERADFWTPLRLVILSVFLASIFGIFITRHGVFLASDLTQEKSETEENKTVLSLLSDAEVDVYSAGTIIDNTEELYKSNNKNHSLVDMANQWNETGARLPYPEALAMALDEKSVRIKLSQTGSNTLNDYKEQLDNDRNLIMDPKFSTFIKPSAYTRYKHDLQDLTSMLHQEIRFQNSEIDEKNIAAFYMVLEKKRVEQIQNNIKENDRVEDQLKEDLAAKKSDSSHKGTLW